MLREYVHPGDRCLDVGCGYGYFTIPLAMLVGPSGAVTAVDAQPQMLAGVKRRAERAGVSERIQLHQADASDLHLAGAFDFALAFWMVHEVRDREGLLRAIRTRLKPAGRLLLAEPKGHVSASFFARTLRLAESVGFSVAEAPGIAFSRAVLLSEPTPRTIPEAFAQPPGGSPPQREP
jgi:ubiquinone/menaquinone biosynthesis C-methylase UbiE